MFIKLLSFSWQFRRQVPQMGILSPGSQKNCYFYVIPGSTLFKLLILMITSWLWLWFWQTHMLTLNVQWGRVHGNSYFTFYTCRYIPFQSNPWSRTKVLAKHDRDDLEWNCRGLALTLAHPEIKGKKVCSSVGCVLYLMLREMCMYSACTHEWHR